jgi:hypothetical protein
MKESNQSGSPGSQLAAEEGIKYEEGDQSEDADHCIDAGKI